MRKLLFAGAGAAALVSAACATTTQEVINNTQQDLDNAQKRLAADQGACPKERK